MPAKDVYHDVVIRALEKEGWSVDDEQHTLDIGKRKLWIDLRISKPDDTRVVLVEIKSFQYSGSDMTYLYGAIGQYMAYRSVMVWLDLYLAIPESATIFDEPVGQAIRQHTNIKLVVYEPNEERIIRWNGI